MQDIKRSNFDLLPKKRNYIDNLKTSGFVNIGGEDILSASEVGQLRELSNELLIQFEKQEQVVDTPTDFLRTVVGEGAWALTRFSQHHPVVSNLIDKVVSDNNVKAILREVLGPDYKVWQIVLRRSLSGDKGLNLHQDSLGETNMVILLTDNLAGDGATLFLPESHLFSKTARELRVEAPAGLLNLLRGLLKPFSGKAGDIGFFFNRTWHGRFSNTTSRNHDAILISFFPSGATFGFGGSYLEWSKEYLSEISGTELGRLIDPSSGTELVGEKLYKVVSQSGATEVPFAIQIADPAGQRLKIAGLGVYGVILLLRVIMPAGRLIRRVIKFVRAGSR